MHFKGKTLHNQIFQNILATFYNKDKYRFFILFLLSIIAGLFEFLGLILIFQFILFLLNPDTVSSVKIIHFFNQHLNMYNNSKISLTIGTIISLLYIFKNVFMLVFTKINNYILEDLSVKTTLKLTKNFIYGDYLTVNSIKSSDKIDILNKVTVMVWQYCLKYINLVSNLIIAIIILSFLFIKFTLCAIFASFLIAFLSFIEYKYLKHCSEFQNKNFSKCLNTINSTIFTVVSAFKEIKLNNKEEYFFNTSKENYKKFASLNKDKYFNDVFHIYFTEISIMITFITVLFILFYTSNFNNQVLITSISTICTAILRLTPVINRAQSSLYYINSNKKTALEILDFDKKFNNVIINNSKEKLNFENTIEFKNLCFKYDNCAYGIKNLNLKINKGDFIGIVGKSGCYKTTLALIISGLIKPDSGEILVDGKPIDNIKKWQNNISFLTQEYNLIFDNIYKNISNNEPYDIKKINNILKNLGISNIDINIDVRLLSEGQKQRIAMASVLYQDRELVILDEATSSIDVISEENINNILRGFKNTKTIISIAHRLQILKNCNKIIYMDKGKIIDIDTFFKLEEKYPEFKKIIELSNFKST